MKFELFRTNSLLYGKLNLLHTDIQNDFSASASGEPHERDDLCEDNSHQCDTKLHNLILPTIKRLYERVSYYEPYLPVMLGGSLMWFSSLLQPQSRKWGESQRMEEVADGLNEHRKQLFVSWERFSKTTGKIRCNIPFFLFLISLKNHQSSGEVRHKNSWNHPDRLKWGEPVLQRRICGGVFLDPASDSALWALRTSQLCRLCHFRLTNWLTSVSFSNLCRI